MEIYSKLAILQPLLTGLKAYSLFFVYFFPTAYSASPCPPIMPNALLKSSHYPWLTHTELHYTQLPLRTLNLPTAFEKLLFRFPSFLLRSLCLAFTSSPSFLTFVRGNDPTKSSTKGDYCSAGNPVLQGLREKRECDRQ